MSRACRVFRDRVHPLVDGALAPSLTPALFAHAAACPECAQVQRSARRVAEQLTRAAALPVPEPPADMVARVMSHLPRRNSRPPLWLAVGGTAAAASASTVLLAALARALPGGSADPLAPGLQAAIESVGSYLSRFGALFEALGAAPGLSAGTAAAGNGTPWLPALALIATGLLGLTAALTLGAARRFNRTPA